MSKLRLIFLLATLAIPFTALPASAQDTPTSSVVAGSIVLPEGSILPDDATILVSVDDTSRADAAAVMLSRLVMQSPGAGSPIPFALSVLPVALEAHPALEPLDITVLVRIEFCGWHPAVHQRHGDRRRGCRGADRRLVVPVVAIGVPVVAIRILTRERQDDGVPPPWVDGKVRGLIFPGDPPTP